MTINNVEAKGLFHLMFQANSIIKGRQGRDKQRPWRSAPHILLSLLA